MSDSRGREIRFSMEGLTCTQCSYRIEKEVGRLPGVSAAAVDLVSGILKISLGGDTDADALLASVKDLVSSIEPGVEVSLERKVSAGLSLPLSHVTALAAGAILWAAAMFLPLSGGMAPGLFLASYFLSGFRVLRTVAENISSGRRIFDEYLLMAAATAGAIALGEFSEAVAVMLFYEAGEAIQSLAVQRSRKSILSLLDIRPDSATLLENGKERRIRAEEGIPGQILLVKPGEKIPLDGVVREGNSSLDASSLTGESAPRDVFQGEEVLAGSVNLTGTLQVTISRPYGESALSRGLRLIEEGRARKAPAERFIAAFAKRYTPAVVLAAGILAILPPVAGMGTYREWGYRALVFLVASCPCALVISIPLAVFGGVGAASRRGVLIKGGNVLEALANVRTVLFDKTGTLTMGRPVVTSVVPAGDMDAQSLLQLAASVETGSNHPVARAVAEAVGEIPVPPGNVEEIPGKGVRLERDGEELIVGNEAMMQEYGVQGMPPEKNLSGSMVHVGLGGMYQGFIVVEDVLRKEAAMAVENLRELGVATVGILSGDRPENVRRAAEGLRLDFWQGGLLPHEKMEHFQRIRGRAGETILFVGDGMNDAPLLASADVGIAMGGLGADAAIEAADGVILDDDLRGAAAGIEIARRTRAIVRQNICFALGVKALVLLLGAFGMASMWEAVFADVGVALAATANAARILWSARTA